jgi:hypothetical protein
MNTRTNKTILLITLMICLATAVYSAVGTFTFRTSGASDTTEVVDLRYPQKVPEDASVTTDSIEDGSITNDKLAEPVSVANGGTGKTTAAEALAALGGASLNGSSTVDFLTEDLNVAGVATFTGFVKLGDAATGIKMKVLTGTTSDTEGQTTVLATGVAASKIVSYSCDLGNPASSVWPANSTLYDGYLYYTYIDSDGRVVVILDATDSENLLSAPITCILWYTE